ncbi:MAG: DUF3800 domain-containing protein [Bacillota bacterium]
MGKATFIYLDESGGLRAESPLLVGAFLTTNQRMIRSIIQYARNLHKYPYELHFQKISSNEKDKRYKVSKTILKSLLACEKDWQVRIIYSNEPDEICRWDNMTVDEVYNEFVEQLILSHGRFFLKKKAYFVLDEKNKAKWNDFIPEKLEILLNNTVKKITGTHCHVRTDHSTQNDFLQLADLFSGAIRQLYTPSNNGNKIELAELILPVLLKKKLIKIVKAS